MEGKKAFEPFNLGTITMERHTIKCCLNSKAHAVLNMLNILNIIQLWLFRSAPIKQHIAFNAFELLRFIYFGEQGQYKERKGFEKKMSSFIRDWLTVLIHYGCCSELPLV
jgi:hypothetical protein